MVRHRSVHRQQGDIIVLILFFKMRKVGQKQKKIYDVISFFVCLFILQTPRRSSLIVRQLQILHTESEFYLCAVHTVSKESRPIRSSQNLLFL
jgi:hypothetical protein